MRVLVSDTSVLVDLGRGGLLEAAFACGLTMIVPDMLYQQELEKENGPYLRALGLGVVALTPGEVELAQQIKKGRAGLSWPDCFALSCAHRPDHVLISGDKTLRSEANMRVGKVYGLLWVLDRMEENGVARAQLHQGLSAISQHPTCRLPKEEVEARIAKWNA